MGEPKLGSRRSRLRQRSSTLVVGVVAGLAAGAVAVLVVGEKPYIDFQY